MANYNIKNLDSNLRIVLSLIILLVSVYTQMYLLAVVAILLFYTGVRKYCYLYKLLKINKKYSIENYYASLLPKYNPSAVFMFDKDGEISFENNSSKKEFSYINNCSDFNITNITNIIDKELTDIFYYDHNKFSYQLDVIGIKNIDSIVVYATDITELIKLNEEIEQTQKEIIYKMGEIGETRSKETGNHVKRVAEYSELLALLFGMDADEAKMLKMASPMHDIGKVGIPDAILNKPGRHTFEEFEIMKTHAQLGYEMLNKSTRPIIQAAAIVAKEHHEKYDGNGYPNGTAGEDIHIYGRITAIADVFDALGSKRVYKDAWKLEKIIALFNDEKSKHFDPKLIELFFANLDKFLLIRDKYQDI